MPPPFQRYSPQRLGAGAGSAIAPKPFWRATLMPESGMVPAGPRSPQVPMSRSMVGLGAGNGAQTATEGASGAGGLWAALLASVLNPHELGAGDISDEELAGQMDGTMQSNPEQMSLGSNGVAAPYDGNLLGGLLQSLDMLGGAHTQGAAKPRVPRGGAGKKGRGSKMTVKGDAASFGPPAPTVPSAPEPSLLRRKVGGGFTPPISGSRDANFESQLGALRMMNGYEGAASKPTVPTDNFISQKRRAELQDIDAGVMPGNRNTGLSLGNGDYRFKSRFG